MRRKVKRIINGNTFEVYQKVGGTTFIRLAGLDVPSAKTREGKAAIRRLRKLIVGKTVTLIPRGRSYSRIL